jgi:hypothetical protein
MEYADSHKFLHVTSVSISITTKSPGHCCPVALFTDDVFTDDGWMFTSSEENVDFECEG